jgi:hypothetical protein
MTQCPLRRIGLPCDFCDGTTVCDGGILGDPHADNSERARKRAALRARMAPGNRPHVADEVLELEVEGD